EAPKAERRHEVAGASVHDSLLALGSERAFEERDGEDLVGSERAVMATWGVEHVVAVAEIVTPESLEASPDALAERIPRRRRSSQEPREPGHRPDRVVPEGIDLYRLARPRRHDPVADLRVHPGELYAGLARCQEPVARVPLDRVARARPVKAEDLLEHRV